MSIKQRLDNIRLVIFDLDGTLVNAYPAIIESFNFTMKKFGLKKRDNDTIRRAVGWGDKQLISPFVDDSILDKAHRLYRKHHDGALRRKTRFLPGAKNILTALKKKKYIIALASNRPKRSTKVILRHLKMSQYFDCIMCGDMLKRAKPYPDILKYILKKFSAKASEALYVGDMTIDVITGKRARVKTVAVVTGSSSRREVSKLKPYKIIKEIRFLTNILN